ncbi:hypothetical protein [Marivita sp. S0852]|uniref:hypothetical protein n=1 Tax=Marivita sp. S0852 TaxID=3373893 RepID=UPI0039826A35
MSLDHQINARRPKALMIIGLVWIGLFLLWAALDAAWWIVAPLALFSLPAIFEAWRNDTAGLRLDHDRLEWYSPRHSGGVDLQDIDHVRFDTRLDFAINARLHLVTGAVIRLPIEALPPYPQFCAALERAGVRHERHHFGFF